MATGDACHGTMAELLWSVQPGRAALAPWPWHPLEWKSTSCLADPGGCSLSPPGRAHHQNWPLWLSKYLWVFRLFLGGGRKTSGIGEILPFTGGSTACSKLILERMVPYFASQAGKGGQNNSILHCADYWGGNECLFPFASGRLQCWCDGLKKTLKIQRNR